MRYKSLACDFDGTLAENGKISGNTLAALEPIESIRPELILVTGRLLEDLFQTFPEYAICDRIVAENGALVYNPTDLSTEAARCSGVSGIRRSTTPAKRRTDRNRLVHRLGSVACS